MSPAGPGTYHRLFDLTDRVFVIAGSGQGIGEAAAGALHEFGARLICVDREQALVDRIATRVGGLAVRADVTDEDSVLASLDRAVAEYGRLDGVVDVVGGARFTPIPKLTSEVWDLQMTANLRHAYLFGRHGAERLAAAEGGSIVFVSSIAAKTGSKAHPAYSVAKSALETWVQCLAEEYGPSAVRANAVAPGPTLTTRMRASWSDDVLEDMAAPTMLRRLGTPAEIAATILFLASPASANITGQTIVADGGVTTRDPVYGSGLNRAEPQLRAAQEARDREGRPWP